MNNTVIKSTTNPYVKKLALLKSKKGRDESGLFLVEGYHLVKEAYLANKLVEVLVLEDTNDYKGVKITIVSEEIIAKLSSTITPQNILGVCKGGYEKELKGKRFLILDDLQDPGNVGTLIRSALGFKIDQIIMSPKMCDAYNDKVLRSTQGGIFRVGLVRMDILEAIKTLQSQEVMVYGTSLQGTNFTENKTKKYAIVLGNEAKGVSQGVQNACDVNILIKTESQLESLNVGVAGSIMMYELYKTLDKE